MDIVNLRGKIYLNLAISLLVISGQKDLWADAAKLETETGGTVAIFEKLGDHVPLGLEFVSDEGNKVVLRDLVDKPTVISLVYFSCRHACPMLLNGVAEVLRKTDLKAGKDFNLITVSFDVNDTAAVAAETKRNYVQAIGKPFPANEWKFLTGTNENIELLTESVGFSFKREANGMFTHPVTLIILSKEGKVTRYLSGTTFLPFDLKMAVTEASEGRVGAVLKRAFLYCFSYDPASRRYVFNVLKVFGTVTLIFVGSFIAYLIVTGKKHRSETR
jgi:protein SCO1/2